jgi:hypothetical protein
LALVPLRLCDFAREPNCIALAEAIAVRMRRKLQRDPDQEQFVGEGAKEADVHVARDMRKPYDYSFA